MELLEGGGYLGWVGVYHELHYLVRQNHGAVKEHVRELIFSQKAIRQWTYKDHYFPNLTAEEKAHWERHSGKYSFRGQRVWGRFSA